MFPQLRQGVFHWYFKRKAELCLLFCFTGGETYVQTREAIWLSHPPGQWLPTPSRPHYSLIFAISRCYSIKTLGCNTTIFTQPDSGWGSKNKCNKCGMGTATPNWRPFLSYPPRHSWCRDLHLPLCSALPRVLLCISFPQPDCEFCCFPHAICAALPSLALIVAHTMVNE